MVYTSGFRLRSPREMVEIIYTSKGTDVSIARTPQVDSRARLNSKKDMDTLPRRSHWTLVEHYHCFAAPPGGDDDELVTVTSSGRRPALLSMCSTSTIPSLPAAFRALGATFTAAFGIDQRRSKVWVIVTGWGKDQKAKMRFRARGAQEPWENIDTLHYYAV